LGRFAFGALGVFFLLGFRPLRLGGGGVCGGGVALF